MKNWESITLTNDEQIVLDAVAKVAADTSVETYIVGGWVRDQILGRDSRDIDIVCVGDGLALAQNTAKLLDPRIEVALFKRFGTAMFHYRGMEIEFVGARKESYTPDSRKPDVSPGTLEDDQLRRDFTINALAISLNEDNLGDLIDPFNGVADLEEKIIRTPVEPVKTFSDDPLRMMRAVRFATQLGFEIDAPTKEGIKKSAKRLKIISHERITTELNKIILAKKPSRGFVLLDELDLLPTFFSEMIALKGVERINGVGHKDNFYHTLKVLDNLSENTDKLWLRWAAIMHDIAKPQTKRFVKEIGWTFYGHEALGAAMVPRIFKRMRLPLDHQMKYVQKLVRLHLRPISLTKENITDSAIRRLLFDAGDEIDDLLLLCEADITSKNKNRKERYLQNYQLVRRLLDEVEEKDRLRNFQPPVTGEEIMTTFALKPSREVGTIKSLIREAILDGDIENNYDAAHQYMMEIGPRVLAGELTFEKIKDNGI